MNALRFFLFPFSIIYNSVTGVRNFLYVKNILKAKEFDIPVINVGNLNVGGTGKTPHVEYLVKLLSKKYKLAILSRGYKRKTTGFILANDGANALEIGDEPFQYFLKFPEISIAVCENRAEGIQKLQHLKQPEIILLDDAFQHRRVKPSLNILLTKYGDLFIDDYVLPVGNLREGRLGANRADAIVVTKCPASLSTDQLQELKSRLFKYGKPIYFSSITYNSKTSGGVELTLKELANFHVLLVTGIAHPKPLLNYLEAEKIQFSHLEYPDHHHFSAKDLKKINHAFDGIKASKKMMLTTEKDYVRLKDSIAELAYLGIGLSFYNQEEVSFDDFILHHIQNS